MATCTTGTRDPCQGENGVCRRGPGVVPRHDAATPGRRTIVLSPEDHGAAKAKFGPIFATRYDVLMTNRTGDLAFVIWSAEWRGGEGIAEKIDGNWVFDWLSSWIS